MQRQTLSRLVGTLFALLFAAFLFVLLIGLFGSSNGSSSNSGSNEDKTFSSLALGETKLMRLNGERVWVTRLAYRDRFSNIKAHVEGGQPFCDLDKQFCVISAETEMQGIELVFTKKRPTQLDNNVPWNGGYVNPVSGQAYDLLGRPYRLNPVLKNKLSNNTDRRQPLKIIPIQ